LSLQLGYNNIIAGRPILISAHTSQISDHGKKFSIGESGRKEVDS